jgi:acetoin utilization protein AcuB
MKHSSPISHYMTPMPHSVGVDQTLSVAHEIMRGHGIRHLPVLSGGVLVGIVSQRDLALLETLKDVDLRSVRVEEAMTAQPYAVDADMPLAEVAKSMAEHKYGAAVVLRHGHIAGIFTTVDAMRALVEILGAA